VVEQLLEYGALCGRVPHGGANHLPPPLALELGDPPEFNTVQCTKTKPLRIPVTGSKRLRIGDGEPVGLGDAGVHGERRLYGIEEGLRAIQK
jgi:hypothetical protein